MKLRFRIKLTSDYHVGAGHGWGSLVDSALLRDADGVPTLRGSTLAGLFRDAMRGLLQTTDSLRALFEPHRQAEELRKQRSLDDRDASIALAYCPPTPAEEACPICRILGSPAAPKRWTFSSARPLQNPTPVKTEQAALNRRCGAQTTARVRLSPRTRRADEGKLFAQEEGDSRLAFAFSVTCPEEGPDVMDEASLLVCSALWIRRFGASRSRGRGACRIRLIDQADKVDHQAEEHWLQHFREVWLEGQPSEPSKPAALMESFSGASESDGQPVCRRIWIRSDEPIVAAQRAEAGNLFETQNYISGSTLWGALAARAARRGGFSRGDGRSTDRLEDVDVHNSPLYAEFQRLFLQGGIRVSPLYPVWRQGASLAATIPAPLDLLTCSSYPGFRRSEDIGPFPHGAQGWAAKPTEPGQCERCAAEPPGEIPPSVKLIPFSEFVTVKRLVQQWEVAQREEMHPRIHPVTRRAAAGNLYGYLGLESGQYFLGEISAGSQADWDSFCKLVGIPNGENGSFALRLGKAVRRGYGLSTAVFEPPSDSETASRRLWIDAPLADRIHRDKEDGPVALTMTLLTDAILPDPWGRFRRSLEDVQWLERLLNDPVDRFHLERGSPAQSTTATVRSFCRARAVDGFSSHLGLPRWRDVAVTAGSAVGFRVVPSQTDADSQTWLTALVSRLDEIEREGIGIRRHEGFGRVAFNHPVYDNGRLLSGANMIAPSELTLQAQCKDVCSVEHQLLQRRWIRTLEDEFDRKKFQSPSGMDERGVWAPVARWLFTHAGLPVQDLQSQLDNFVDLSLFTEEQVHRDKTSKYAKDAIEHLVALLSSLNTILEEEGELLSKDEKTKVFEKGVRILAEQLAGASNAT